MARQRVALAAGEHVVLLGDVHAGVAAREAGLTVRDAFVLFLPRRVLLAWLCRAPLESSIIENVITNGTGALSIDPCRVPFGEHEDVNELALRFAAFVGVSQGYREDYSVSLPFTPHQGGRWPTNVMLVHGEGCLLEEGLCEVTCPVMKLGMNARFFPAVGSLAEAVAWLGRLAATHSRVQLSPTSIGPIMAGDSCVVLPEGAQTVAVTCRIPRSVRGSQTIERDSTP